jgi:hypothetical protein
VYFGKASVETGAQISPKKKRIPVEQIEGWERP